MFGPTGYLMLTISGISRIFYQKHDIISEFIPSDYTVNGIIASAWDVAIHESRLILSFFFFINVIFIIVNLLLNKFSEETNA